MSRAFGNIFGAGDSRLECTMEGRHVTLVAVDSSKPDDDFRVAVRNGHCEIDVENRIG